MFINRRNTCLALATAPITMSTAAQTQPKEFAHVPWSQQTSIYEVNVRQFTAAGTLAAFATQLPRLAAMGVGILWLMPVQPIGKQNRKGGLGSYYSISDYTAVNPEFGTLADFKSVVTKAHALGMKVILDWVANHTAWDHPWVASHKQRYKLNAQGDVYSVTFNAGAPDVEYWTDVVGLDYTAPGAQQDLWPAMTEAMAFWLQQTDIDGFRCDVASLVPTPFWEQARLRLERIKPVFMLAESDKVDLHAKAFDMTYDWDLFDQFKAIAKGKADATALQAWWQRRLANYPADAYRMSFTANHDTNSWHGSCQENFGSLNCFKAFSTLAAVLPGMPLVYGGQEAYFKKRLAFFERDPIDWKSAVLGNFYTELLLTKKHHPALANDHRVGTFLWLDAGSPHVVQLLRQHRGKAVGLLANLSAEPRVCQTLGGEALTLKPWACEVSVT